MITVIQGNCLDVLPTLEAQSVQCCVTSPPYWGLRDYGTATWEGGDSECGHVESINGMSKSNTLGRPEQGGMTPLNAANISKTKYFKHICDKCGARRIDSQLGLESTPEIYVANMVRVFREVWRVMKDDGTCWINIGDSYAAGGQNSGSSPESLTEKQRSNKGCRYERRIAPAGLKPKDLCGIPWRLAFALQADGWYLRSDIIWHKPNPMTESVTDRPTKAHEYIFLLTKQERYFYDADAIREPNGDNSHPGIYRSNGKNSPYNVSMRRIGRDVLELSGRNKRTVWTVATQPYKESHFAVFPEDLIKPCIMAGSRIGDTVLDPFAGSGTVGEVCVGMGRKSVLIELNPAYVEMIKIRTNTTIGML